MIILRFFFLPFHPGLNVLVSYPSQHNGLCDASKATKIKSASEIGRKRESIKIDARPCLGNFDPCEVPPHY